MLGRYGRERFCLVVPHASPTRSRTPPQRLRAAVEAHQLDLGELGQWNVTASLGCAYQQMNEPGDLAKLMAAADAQLYHAKRAGGNQVAVAFEASRRLRPLGSRVIRPPLGDVRRPHSGALSEPHSRG